VETLGLRRGIDAQFLRKQRTTTLVDAEPRGIIAGPEERAHRETMRGFSKRVHLDGCVCRSGRVHVVSQERPRLRQGFQCLEQQRRELAAFQLDPWALDGRQEWLGEHAPGPAGLVRGANGVTGRERGRRLVELFGGALEVTSTSINGRSR